MPRSPIVLALVIGLAGCGGDAIHQTDGSPAADTVTINETYRVSPQRAWNRKTRGSSQRWTVAGPRLHQLRLYGGLEPGQALFAGADADNAATWDGRARAHAIAELVRANLAQWGAVRVATRNLRPADFGPHAGFRMDLSFASPNGLEYTGFATGTTTPAADGDRLQLILYFGTKSRHFKAYRADVEALLGSVDFIDAS